MNLKLRIGKVELPNPIVLGPMAGVTDLPFRLIVKRYGVGLLVTEMVSAKALYYDDRRTKELTRVADEEHPVSLQLFGSEPEIMAIAVEKMNSHPAEMFDINMGCPAPKIIKNGDGSALMKNPKLAAEVVRSAVNASSKPVTVKFRKGWDDSQVNAVEFAKMMEDAGASAITVHGRTREQFYSGRADYDIIRDVVKAVKIPVIGNGDIFSVEDAKRMIDHTGCSGIMVARGAMGNPWLIREIGVFLETGTILPKPDDDEKVRVALEHFDLLIREKGERTGLLEMRKHAAWYIKGIKNSSQAKDAINKATTREEVERLLKNLMAC
jgi:tRNA-dihydrouridine synthase B